MYGLCPWVWSGRVADKVRGSVYSEIWHVPDFVGDLVAGADVWSCLVGCSPARAVKFRNDTTRPYRRQSLAGTVPNSTARTRTGLGRTRPDKIRSDPTDFVAKVWSGPRSGIWTILYIVYCVSDCFFIFFCVYAFIFHVRPIQFVTWFGPRTTEVSSKLLLLLLLLHRESKNKTPNS